MKIRRKQLVKKDKKNPRNVSKVTSFELKEIIFVPLPHLLESSFQPKVFLKF
jgi:hypothetical protein